MSWSRRSVLRAIGASAMAPLAGAFVHACTRRPEPGTPGRAAELRGIEDIRKQLRELVHDMSQRFAHASAVVTIRRIGHATADELERTTGREALAEAHLRVGNRGRYFERTTTDLSRAGLQDASTRLRARAAANYQSPRSPRPLAKPQDFATKARPMPNPAAWIGQVTHLYDRSRHVGGSRVVYRSAYLSMDEVHTVYVGDGRDLLQHFIRSRAGVLLLAQRSTRSGTMPVLEVAENSGLMGFEVADLPDSALESAADRVLEMVTPSPPPTGEMAVILDPSMSALIAHQCVAPALLADRWLAGESRAAEFMGQKIGSENVTIIDDPTLADGYGSYRFDDEGQMAAPTVLVDRGRLGAALTDRRSALHLQLPRTANGRRLGPFASVAPRPSNIVFAAGTAQSDELVREIERGLLIEGGLSALGEPRTWRFSARAMRAHQIVKGTRTGVLYGGVDIRGDVPSLLAQVRSVSSQTGRWSSSLGPASTMSGAHILTRIEVL